MDDSQEWIAYAERDLHSAEFLMGMYPCPFEIICYHCQQAAEKALKAVLVEERRPIPKTHDLLRLLADFSMETTMIHRYCGELSNYAVVTRYPYHYEQAIDENRTKRALWAANEVLQFCRKILT